MNSPDDWIKLATLIIACLGFLYVVRKFSRDQTVARALKAVDVAIHCANRYNELSKFKSEILKNYYSDPAHGEDLRSHLIHDWYRQFWALKSDQFDFWLNGVLDHDSFFDWSCHLVQRISIDIQNRGRDADDGKSKTPWDTVGLQESWEIWNGGDAARNRISHGGINPRFMRFTNGLFDCAKQAEKKDGTEEVIYTSMSVLALMEEFETGQRHFGSIEKLQDRLKTNSLAANKKNKGKRHSNSGENWRQHFWRGMSFSEYRAFVENDLTVMLYEERLRAADTARHDPVHYAIHEAAASRRFRSSDLP